MRTHRSKAQPDGRMCCEVKVTVLVEAGAYEVMKRKSLSAKTTVTADLSSICQKVVDAVAATAVLEKSASHPENTLDPTSEVR